MPSAFIHQRILEDPANTGGIGAENWRHPIREPSGDLVQVLQNPASGPIDVCPILEDDVDIGVSKVGEASHKFYFGGSEHGCSNGVSDLILHDAGIATHPCGVDNDLNIR